MHSVERRNVFRPSTFLHLRSEQRPTTFVSVPVEELGLSGCSFVAVTALGPSGTAFNRSGSRKRQGALMRVLALGIGLLPSSPAPPHSFLAVSLCNVLKGKEYPWWSSCH